MAKALPEVDPLAFMPKRYEDRRTATPSNRFERAGPFLASGRPIALEERPTSSGSVLKARMKDSAGFFSVIFFRYDRYHRLVFKPGGREVFLWGTPKFTEEGWAFHHPELPDEVGRIIAVYGHLKGIGDKRLREHVWERTLGLIRDKPDEVPLEMLRERDLPMLGEALTAIHRPDGRLPEERDYLRLAYRELFEVKQRMLAIPRPAAPVIVADMEPFYRRLPFSLTGEQMKAVTELLADMRSGVAMRRVLIGDVSSGKTVVAQAAAYACLQNDRRVLVLSPSTVLAGQLYESFGAVFGKEAVGLWTANEKTTRGMIVIGTHAILRESFSGVALVIFDEQQKWGVQQRNSLLGPVHALQASATPIPRTVAHLLTGAVDFTWINELPFKRQVTTKVVTKADKAQVLGHLRQVVSSGGKALVIYPLVEEKNESNYKSVEGVRTIWQELYPEQTIWVHGRIEEKMQVVEDFRKSTIKRILIATSLIEVGIDVPEATMLIIVGAERFGLAQLHQMRGRIGRRGDRSFCYLMAVKEGGTERLRPLQEVDDGLRISAIDADIRGWGSMFGEQQTGHCLKLPWQDLYKKAAPLVDEDARTFTLMTQGKESPAVIGGSMSTNGLREDRQQVQQ